MMSTKKEKNQQIQVFVRVRPLNKQEGNSNVVEIKNSKELSIKHHSTVRTYNFDRVFGPNSTQLDVYKLVAEPTVAEVIAGYNCTVLAYGQTGTGKTYTMAGNNINDLTNTESRLPWFEDPHSGIIPRTLTHMFDELRVQNIEHTVRVSYLELYNEEIFDLLSPVEDNLKLKLYDDSMKKGSVIVQGLTEIAVNTKYEVLKILEKGAEKRRIASTLMNSQSSRSHTVFCITVHTKENAVDGEDLLKTGKLYLVDLAGSENIKQSGATELRAREAFSINQSLLTLGRCIAKLLERSTHIPYRESKLTRLLQDSLGGRTKTTLIATISPAFCNADESLNTLDYASRAKHITNKPEINQRLSKKTLMKEYTEEIERLRKDLLATRMGRGIYLDQDNYEAILKERDVHKDEIAEKIGMIRVLQEQMEKKDQLCEQLNFSLAEHKKDVEIKVQTIYTLENKLEEASKEITDLQFDNELKQYILGKYSETEEMLKSTAKELIHVADMTTADTRKLHDKLDILLGMNRENKQLCEQYISEFYSKTDNLSKKLGSFHENEYTFNQTMKKSLKYIHSTNSSFKTDSEEMIKSLLNIVENLNVVKGQSQVSDSVDCEKLKNHDQFITTVIPQMNHVFNVMSQQQSFISSLVECWQKMLENKDQQVNEFVTSYKKMINAIKIDVFDHIDKQINLCQQVQKQCLKSDQLKKSYQQEMEARYESLATILSEMKSLTEEYRKSTDADTEQCAKDLYELHNNLTNQQEIFDSTSETSHDFISDFRNKFQVSSTENQNYIKLSASENTKMNVVIEESKLKADKVIQEHLEFSNSTYDNIRSVAVEQNESQSSKIEMMKESLVDLVEQHGSQSSEYCETFTKNVEEMIEEVEINEQCCSELTSIVSTDLDNYRERFRKLYTTRLKEYKPTGQTPRRQVYKYPRTLKETKPHDNLVEEYQKTRSVSVSRSTEDKENTLVRSSSESNICKVFAENDLNCSKTNKSMSPND